MPNVIYRGPADRQPTTVNLPVGGAYKPGIFVTEGASSLTQATSGAGRLRLLSNREFAGQDIDSAYANGDTGVAYILEPGQRYQARVAAGTYAKGDKLTVNSSGYLAAVGDGETVVAYFDGAPGSYSAGDFADIEIANSFTTPAAS